MANNELVDRIERAIKEKSDIGLDEPFEGPNQESVPFESRWKYMGEHHWMDGREVRQMVYVRVGDRIFLDDRLRQDIPKEVRGEGKNNILYLSKFDSSLSDPFLIRYSALTSYAMDCVDLNGKHVLDLGSADAVLGIIANLQGAKITAVDIDPAMESKLRRHILANNLDSSDFQFIPADIKSSGFLDGVQRPIDMVVANLGPHYEGADMAAIELLGHLPRATTFIGGGYTNPKDPENYYAKYNANTAIGALKQRGFNEFRYVTEGVNDACPRLTFIAEKR